MRSGLGSVRLRAALAAGFAAALTFGAGALWLRHTVYVDQFNVPLTHAEDVANYISRGGYLAALGNDSILFVRKGVIIGYTGEFHAFVCSDVARPHVPVGATSIYLPRAHCLPGNFHSPLEGRTVTVVSVALDPGVFGDLGITFPINRATRQESPFSVDSFITWTNDSTDPPDQLVILVPSTDADEAVAALDRGFLVGLPLAVLFVAVTVWLLTGRALRPVDAIRAELADITATDLGRRVPVPRSRDVIGRLAVTTNATLDRLEGAIESQRRFVADAAHELRSPVSVLRTQLEVALAHPDPTPWPAIGTAALSNVERLQRLAEDLLLLSSAASPHPATDRVVDLAAVAEELVAERGHPAGPALRTVLTGPVLVRGDEAQLSRLVRNLVDNALRHAATGVTIEVVANSGTAELTVADDGPGIAPADADRVFDRFTRLDDARDRDAGGAGLGLPIARELATRHGGTLTLVPSEAGARFVVRLPIAQSGPDSATTR